MLEDGKKGNIQTKRPSKGWFKKNMKKDPLTV